MTELVFDDLTQELKDLLQLGMQKNQWYYSLTFWADELEPLVQAGWVEKEGWANAGGLRYRITALGLTCAGRLV